MRPTIALRAGGGLRGGFGHIRRCLTLAHAIQQQGGRAVLIMNAHGGAPAAPPLPADVETVLVEEVELQSLRETTAHVAAAEAVVLLIDAYDVPLSTLAQITVPLALIADTRPSTPLPAALVTSAVSDPLGRWPVRSGTRLLLGPRYALVREEFARQSPRISPAVRRVLVTTGGTDVNGSIVTLTRAVHRGRPGAAVDVVVGPYFACEAVKALEAIAATATNVTLHHDAANLTHLMAVADLAVTGGGQTVFELAASGVPAVAVCLVANQAENVSTLRAAGALVDAGSIDDEDLVFRVEHLVAHLASSRERREQVSLAGRATVDGLGAQRVADELLRLGMA